MLTSKSTRSTNEVCNTAKPQGPEAPNPNEEGPEIAKPNEDGPETKSNNAKNDSFDADRQPPVDPENPQQCLKTKKEEMEELKLNRSLARLSKRELFPTEDATPLGEVSAKKGQRSWSEIRGEPTECRECKKMLRRDSIVRHCRVVHKIKVCIHYYLLS